jgi:hypothetical protein
MSVTYVAVLKVARDVAQCAVAAPPESQSAALGRENRMGNEVRQQTTRSLDLCCSSIGIPIQQVDVERGVFAAKPHLTFIPASYKRID